MWVTELTRRSLKEQRARRRGLKLRARRSAAARSGLETNGIRAYLAMMKGKTLLWDRVPPGCRPRSRRKRIAAARRERAI